MNFQTFKETISVKTNTVSRMRCAVETIKIESSLTKLVHYGGKLRTRLEYVFLINAESLTLAFFCPFPPTISLWHMLVERLLFQIPPKEGNKSVIKVPIRLKFPLNKYKSTPPRIKPFNYYRQFNYKIIHRIHSTCKMA